MPKVPGRWHTSSTQYERSTWVKKLLQNLDKYADENTKDEKALGSIFGE